MALQTSGPIYLSQIQAEFGGPNYYISTYFRGGGYTTTNNLNVPSSGTIYFSQFYGAVRAVGGSASFGVGSSYMYIPPFQWLTIDVRAGAGGGGGGNSDIYAGNAGGAGGNSQAGGAGALVTAYGGAGGAGSDYYGGSNYYPSGEPRAASGYGTYSTGGGSWGGTGGTYGYTVGQNGGHGGISMQTFYPGQLTVGGVLYTSVGGGGAGGYGGYGGANGSNGGDGAIYVSWG